MGKLDRRSVWLLLGMLVTLVVLALFFDLRLPRRRLLEPPADAMPLPPPLVDLAQRTRGLGMLVRLLATLTTTAGMGVFIVALMPQRLNRIVEPLRAGNWGLSLIIGGVTLLGGTLLAVLAVISVIAAPFLVLITLGLAIATALGTLVSAISLGQWLRHHISPEPSLLADLLTGVLLLGFVLFLPFGRNLVLLGIITIGVGALLLTRLGSEF